MNSERSKDKWLSNGESWEPLMESSFFSIEKQKHQDRTYYRVLHPGAVVIIPILPNGDLIFVKQYRMAIGEILLEFPAGLLEKNENPFLCARRELQEEIGFDCPHIHWVRGFYTAPGFTTEYLHLFLANELVESRMVSDDTEEIDTVILTFEEAWQALQEGKIVDAKTLIGIYHYRELLKDAH